MTPFEQFFATDWQRELDAVQIPGMPDASWDRKAAWLLWRERDCPKSFTGPPPWHDPKYDVQIAIEDTHWRDVFGRPTETSTTNATPQPKMPWEK